LGRKQSKDQNAQHEHIPKVSEPVKSPGHATCNSCGRSHTARADNGKPIAHYKPTGNQESCPNE
jgi:hypothetical protein